MNVGGAKIGICKVCGERANLTEDDLCDDCCEADEECSRRKRGKNLAVDEEDGRG